MAELKLRINTSDVQPSLTTVWHRSIFSPTMLVPTGCDRLLWSPAEHLHDARRWFQAWGVGHIGRKQKLLPVVFAAYTWQLCFCPRTSLLAMISTWVPRCYSFKVMARWCKCPQDAAGYFGVICRAPAQRKLVLGLAFWRLGTSYARQQPAKFWLLLNGKSFLGLASTRGLLFMATWG